MMDRLIRYSQWEDFMIQYVDGKLSFLPRKHSLALNLATGAVSMRKRKDSLAAKDNLPIEPESIRAYVHEISNCLNELQQDYNKAVHMNVSLNLRTSHSSFSNGIDTHYSQRVGRIAVCFDGRIQHFDFGVNSNIQELCRRLKQSYLPRLLCAKNLSASVPINTISDFSRYVFILTPQAAAFFVHEVIGHVLEADNWESKKFAISTDSRLLPSSCHIVDDPSESEFLMYGKYDDAGNPIRRTAVIEDGYISDFVATSRSSEYSQPPLCRMSNLHLCGNPHGKSCSELINDYERCFVLEEISNGGINPHSGDYFISCPKQYCINENREKVDLQPCTYYGHISDLRHIVVEIGKDFNSFIGVCSKGGQNLFVCNGSPSIVISSFNVV